MKSLHFPHLLFTCLKQAGCHPGIFVTAWEKTLKLLIPRRPQWLDAHCALGLTSHILVSPATGYGCASDANRNIHWSLLEAWKAMDNIPSALFSPTSECNWSYWRTWDPDRAARTGRREMGPWEVSQWPCVVADSVDSTILKMFLMWQRNKLVTQLSHY